MHILTALADRTGLHKPHINQWLNQKGIAVKRLIAMLLSNFFFNIHMDI